MKLYILIFIILVNALTFIAYGIDKLKAKRNWWRISEATLLFLSFAAGSLGALLGMVVWNHKTQHKKFRFGVPFIMLLHIALSLYLVYRFFGSSDILSDGYMRN